MAAWRGADFFGAATSFTLAAEPRSLRLAASAVAVSLASLALRLSAEAACSFCLAALASRAWQAAFSLASAAWIFLLI